MGVIWFYIRKSFTLFRQEVLVLPSRVAVLVFVLTMLLIPVFIDDPYLLRILIFTSVFAIFAASWDLLSGFTGQVNFGHALFFGVAAYTSGLINVHYKIPHILSIPLGAIAGVLAGLVVGIPCLRLRGTYLALTTLAFPIILMGIVFAIPDVTGGELGVSGLDRLSSSRIYDYYITVVLMLVLTFIMWKITDSKTGIILTRDPRRRTRREGGGYKYNTLQTSCVLFEWLFCRHRGRIVCAHNEDGRPLHTGSVYVFPGHNLVRFRRDSLNIRSGGRRFHTLSVGGIS